MKAKETLQGSFTRRIKIQRAFTLVELLVVISIIALLLSILMPALNKVKEQAKILSCTTNTKQIGLLVFTYQADNNNYVPVVLNRWAGEIPAENRFVSLALRNYSSEKVRLPVGLAPGRVWTTSEEVDEYFSNYMPKFFACPFTRNKQPGASEWEYGSKVLSGTRFTTMTNRGRNESYTTWLWPLVKGQRYTIYPSGGDNGMPKYGVLLWHTAVENRITNPATRVEFDKIVSLPMKWGKRQLRQTKVGSMAEATILSCDKGETTGTTGKLILNPGSHKKSGTGGTNVLFGDGHIGWVKGTQIGWK